MTSPQRLIMVLALVAVATTAGVGDSPASTGEPGVRGRAGEHKRVHQGQRARDLARGPRTQPKMKPLRDDGRPLRYLVSGGAANGPVRNDGDGRRRSRAPSPPVGQGFAALNDANFAIPPDVAGAVGTQHLVTMLNTEVRIQERNGTEVSRMTLDDFWAPVLTGSSYAFDPRVQFDPYYEANGSTGRWIAVAVTDAMENSSSILVGASETADPTGAWNLYSLDADATNALWADFPSIGFNKNWIVVQLNMFAMSGSGGTSHIYAFDKAGIVEGTGASYTRWTDSNGFVQAPAVTYSDTVEEMYLVEDWYGSDPARGGLGDVRIRKITKDPGTGDPVLDATSVYTTTSNTWQDFSSQNGFGAPQLGSTKKLDVGDARITGCVHRNSSLWCAHTVLLPSTGNVTRTAVQWWQINTNPLGTLQQIGRIDDATGATWYAFPTIAVNADGDALIGYSKFSATTYPSAGYAFRAAGDAAGTFRDPVLVKAGEAPYYKTFGGQENRWGDYSSTVVDPLNDLDLWTLQQYAALPSGGYDRWGTWWARAAAAALTAPSSVTDGTTANFVGTVKNLTASNFVMRPSGSSSDIAATVSCWAAGGASVNCVTGPVSKATIKPSSPLLPGETYTTHLNPGGAPSEVLRHASGDPIGAQSASFRALTSHEESSVAVSPRWRAAGASAAYGGSYLVDHLAGSRAHFKFTTSVRTTVSWYSVLGPNQGLATVYIDNVPIKTYNGYASRFVYRYRRSFTVNPGTHTFSIVVKGQRGSSRGTGTQVAVDAFAVGGAFFANPGTCGSPWSTNNCVLQAWRIAGASGASGGAYALSDLAGSSSYFTFKGTGVHLYMTKGPAFGKAAIYIDGVYKGTFDAYRSSVLHGVRLTYRLANGVHTVRVVVAGTRNPSSRGTYAGVDRFIAI